MPTVALTLEFDGTNFVGWQIQDNGRSVQEEVQKALTALFKQEIKVQGCSRTDAGVHARGLVCSGSVPFIIPEDRLPLACNALLPDDIAVVKAKYVKEGFNARFDSLGKRYIYRIYQGKVRSPLNSRYAYYTSFPLDIDSMKEAAKYFEGEHDFKGFCAVGGSQKTTIRRLNEVRINVQGKTLEIEVRGEAFLYNMVRIIAGTIFYVGIGKINAKDIPDIINSCQRERAGKTLPPEGLTLEEVYYNWDETTI